MKKFSAICLAVIALAAVPLTQAGAHEAADSSVVVPVAGTGAALPVTVHLDETVIVEHHRHYYHHHHHYYHHRYYYRHGVRHYY